MIAFLKKYGSFLCTVAAFFIELYPRALYVRTMEGVYYTSYLDLINVPRVFPLPILLFTIVQLVFEWHFAKKGETKDLPRSSMLVANSLLIGLIIAMIFRIRNVPVFGPTAMMLLFLSLSLVLKICCREKSVETGESSTDETQKGE